MTNIGIFIFRRDFRIDDNLALSKLSKKVDKIIPIFILDPFQILENEKNKYYKSNSAIQFMIESLIDLNKDLYLLLIQCRINIDRSNY